MACGFAVLKCGFDCLNGDSADAEQIFEEACKLLEEARFNVDCLAVADFLAVGVFNRRSVGICQLDCNG